MTALIGEWSDTRPACGDIHVPAVVHPQMGLTWCICGDQQWPGRVPVLKYRWVYDHPGPRARLLGWDCYWLDVTA